MEKVNIVSVSNFDLDNYNESFVARNVRKDFAYGIAEYLNETHSGNYSPNYYVVKPRNYVLKRFEP